MWPEHKNKSWERRCNWVNPWMLITQGAEKMSDQWILVSFSFWNRQPDQSEYNWRQQHDGTRPVSPCDPSLCALCYNKGPGAATGAAIPRAATPEMQHCVPHHNRDMSFVASYSLYAPHIESWSLQGHGFFYNNCKWMGFTKYSALPTATRDWVTVTILQWAVAAIPSLWLTYNLGASPQARMMDHTSPVLRDS